MRLDHVTMGVPESLTHVVEQAKSSGFPFQPTRWKTSGHHQWSHVWFGHTYLEFVTPASDEAKPLDLALVLRVSDLSFIQTVLEKQGVRTEIRSSQMLKSPHQLMMCGAIPGTSIHIGFIEYSDSVFQDLKAYIKTTVQSRSVYDIHYIEIQVPEWTSAATYVQQVFPHSVSGPKEATVPIQAGTLKFTQSSDRCVFVQVQGEHGVGQRFKLDPLVLDVVTL